MSDKNVAFLSRKFSDVNVQQEAQLSLERADGDEHGKHT